MARAASRALTSGLLAGRDDRDDAAATADAELNDPRALREDRVVLAEAGVAAGAEAAAPLPHDNRTAAHEVAVVSLDAEPAAEAAAKKPAARRPAAKKPAARGGAAAKPRTRRAPAKKKEDESDGS